VDAYLKAQHGAALLIVQGGKLRLERYGLGFDGSGRWTSSVAKSFTSTLVGAALKDGLIKSMDDKVSDYIADMKGSAYDDVSVRQLLTMTSGVAWNEDYGDPKSDVARFNNHVPEPGVDALVSYMRKLPRGARRHALELQHRRDQPGGRDADGRHQEAAGRVPAGKIWQPVGMEQKATWLLSKTGKEISGCCLQAALRDYARFGQFILEGAKVGGEPLVPEGWLQQATTKQADIHEPGRGYGYQWWTYDDGSFSARGIFGQGVFIDPKRQLVIVTLSDWAKAGAANNPQSQQREAMYKTVQKAVDDESAAR
jgi:CubicO group peptidase (beta-lactamase class C family)